MFDLQIIKQPLKQIRSFIAYVMAICSASIIDKATINCKVKRQLTGV